MKNRWIPALAMLMCLCLLTGCQSGQRYDYQSANNTGKQNTSSNQGSYDPLAEEDDYDDIGYWADVKTPAPATSTPAPTVRSEYAGATPVPIDPIDKPTPTQIPPLGEFKYQVYDATKLGLSFEGPLGWTKDDSTDKTFIIQNPDLSKSTYPATLTVRAEAVSAQYSSSQMETVVKNMLTAIGNGGFSDYSTTYTASRTLLGKTGVYADYNGTLTDGREVYGRVHVGCVNKVLYTIHITTPKAYWNDYKEQVYDHLRDTLKVTQ